MNLQNQQIFANLCESIINEVSSSLNLVRQYKNGDAVIQYLHKNRQLAHNQNYQKISKISWADLKDSYRGAWVLIVGKDGVGAIQVLGNRNGYAAVAVDPATNEPQMVQAKRSDQITDFLKERIGKFLEYYAGETNLQARTKSQERAGRQADQQRSEQWDTETVINKFKPVWARAINSAIPDVKGMVQTMIKNDAYEKAEYKIEQLKKLTQMLEQLETGNLSDTGVIHTAVSLALAMTASHYYPESTGKIERSRYGGGYQTENRAGTQLVLRDIAAGDQKKLSATLSFFKRALISL